MDYGKIIDIIEIEKEKWEGLIIVTSKSILTIGISSFNDCLDKVIYKEYI